MQTMQSGDQSYRPDPTWQLPLHVRRALLLAPPLALAVLEVFHPNPAHNVQALMDASTWFVFFHVIQLVLTGLVALSVLLLAADYGRASAWTTRLGIGVFLIFFSSYDVLAGIGTGLAMRTARGLPVEQQEGVFSVVEGWPALGPVFALSIVGTLGWTIAVGALARAVRRLGASGPEWITLAMAAVFLLGGHPFPAGTLAFGSLFVAVALHEWAPLHSRAAARGKGESGE